MYFLTSKVPPTRLSHKTINEAKLKKTHFGLEFSTLFSCLSVNQTVFDHLLKSELCIIWREIPFIWQIFYLFKQLNGLSSQFGTIILLTMQSSKCSANGHVVNMADVSFWYYCFPALPTASGSFILIKLAETGPCDLIGTRITHFREYKLIKMNKPINKVVSLPPILASQNELIFLSVSTVSKAIFLKKRCPKSVGFKGVPFLKKAMISDTSELLCRQTFDWRGEDT
ncbi:hypothetical protein EGR_03699 [Echinococcus granulosus]|uniref:Uncharacterized protein n=1 Tax=Echinococcus granulosus TaxID=6210 RepID=W6V566_ECHGR|nr:hypothetical protein EGR_03699 [Echinococcus granulosus]EUB61409.1 hypothetical protein EGR_03699 [Echinococcus granulosus]